MNCSATSTNWRPRSPASARASVAWSLRLPDGARWAQTDKRYMDKPKIGAKIKIEKAVLGSYMASINGRPGFRVERINTDRIEGRRQRR